MKGVLNTFTIFLLCVLFQSLLRTHDSVAKRDFEPALPPLPDDAMEEDEESVKIVSLVKAKEPLVSICVTVNLQSDHQQKLSDFSLHLIVYSANVLHKEFSFISKPIAKKTIQKCKNIYIIYSEYIF